MSDINNQSQEPYNHNALANSVDNAVQAILKDRRRGRIRRFIFQILIIGLLIIIGFGLFGISTNVTNNPLMSQPHTAIININGEISASTNTNADLIITSLNNAFENSNSQAIILRINSPGGSPVQSGMVYDEIKRLHKLYPKKMIYSVVEDVCASGAYYIASATDYIYADKASMIGSIGVLMDGFGFDKAIDKFGVQRRLYTAGKNKGMLDAFSPEMPEHKAYIQSMLDNIHQQFINAVKQGRGKRLKETETPEIFSGLIWSGDKAVNIGLIDGLNTTAGVARDIIKQKELVDYTVQEGLADRLAKQFGASFGSSVASKFTISLH